MFASAGPIKAGNHSSMPARWGTWSDKPPWGSLTRLVVEVLIVMIGNTLFNNVAISSAGTERLAPNQSKSRFVSWVGWIGGQHHMSQATHIMGI